MPDCAVYFCQGIDNGNINIPCWTNYYDALDHGSNRSATTVDELLSRESKLGKPDVCSDYPASDDFLNGVTVRLPPSASQGPVCALIHAGAKGAASPVHFDWDFSWVLHHCLRGRKTFFIIPPEGGWLLAPVLNMSSYDLPRLSPDSRKELLEAVQGRAMVLEEGQSVHFPSCWWHAVYYDEGSFACSIRHSAPPLLRPLGILPRSAPLARLGWLLHQAEENTVVSAVRRVLEAFFTQADWEERYWRMQKLYEDLLLSLGGRQRLSPVNSRALNIEMNAAPDIIAEEYTLPQLPAPEPDEMTFIFYAYRNDLIPKALMGATTALGCVRCRGIRPRRGLVPSNRIIIQEVDQCP